MKWTSTSPPPPPVFPCPSLPLFSHSVTHTHMNGMYINNLEEFACLFSIIWQNVLWVTHRISNDFLKIKIIEQCIFIVKSICSAFLQKKSVFPCIFVVKSFSMHLYCKNIFQCINFIVKIVSNAFSRVKIIGQCLFIVKIIGQCIFVVKSFPINFYGKNHRPMRFYSNNHFQCFFIVKIISNAFLW